MKYLILKVFCEVPSHKAAVLSESEAERFVYDFCEENHLTYKGLDRVQYRATHENYYLEVAPVEDDPKLGYYWGEDEKTDIRKTVQA